MPVPRRLWDSCIVIGYLAGYEDLRPDCPLIIDQAERGELEIVVSAMATVEAAYLEGYPDQDSEALIQEFFSREYIIPVGIDTRIAEIARGLVRKYRQGPKLEPPDAAHLASAIQWHIPLIETTDPDLLRLNELEGNPRIRIRRPLYEGPQRLSGF
ncbi:MAG: PIN domain-containing protein [Chloroflexi bacterium]|nr:PIN domain-containing protein [Chloroflexota bacterium]